MPLFQCGTSTRELIRLVRTATRRAIPGLFTGSGSETENRWWDLGDGSCIAAWDPIIASSNADALLDRSGNGNDLTYRTGSGGWVDGSGFALPVSGRVFDTGIVWSTSYTWIMSVYLVGTSALNDYLWGSSGTGDTRMYYIPNNGGGGMMWGLGDSFYTTPNTSTGYYVLAVVGDDGYKNNSLHRNGSGWSGTNNYTVYINGKNDTSYSSSEGVPAGSYFESLAIYNKKINSTERTLLYNEMIALRP